ncbi:MAG: PKD domain-containing protein [Methanosarcinales archaeon]|nr:PKD domain-containing protein [Methanosarcinales archaeon]
MNMKRMTVSIVTAMVVMTLIAVMIGPAAAFNYSIGKSTLTEPGGAVDNGLEYTVGQQVNYSMYFMPTSENCVITSVKDIFPDGTEEYLAPNPCYIPLNQYEPIGWETTWVVNGDGIGSDGKIVNNLEVEGFDADCNSFTATAPKSSNIIVDISFTFAATCCMGATVTPEWSGPVAWHQWIIDGVPGPVIYTAPTPKELTSCGSYVVTLKGGPDTDDLDNYKEFSDTIHIACEPIVEVEQIPGCVDVDDSVEFRLESLTNDTPIDTYEWTFTNGVPGSGVLSWDGDPTITRTIPAGGTTATLKVTDDLGCYDTDSVSVSTCPPQEVPILTPAGMVALIGMLCIVGAGRILTKGRRS